MATVAFLHAHPDDEAIATGGSMLLAREQGHRVVLILATNGECGEPVPGVLEPGEDLGDRRRAEAERAGAILGAHRVEFLGYRDSGMMDEPTNDDPRCFWQADVDQAAERLAAILRDEEVELLTVYDDHGGYGHPDHIQVHRVGVEAARRAGVARVLQATMNRSEIVRSMDEAIAAGMADDEMVERRQELGEETFGSAEDIITHGIDVGRFTSAKREAMAAHASQIDGESFFMAMEEEQFAGAFGTEWYIQCGASAAGPPFADDLFADR